MPRRFLVLAFILGLAFAGGRGAPAAAQDAGEFVSTKGKFLVASPDMPDPRFAATVIYMVDHSREGAFGLVVNRVGARRPLAELLAALGIAPAEPPGAAARAPVELHWGGPVQPNNGFVLHSDDHQRAQTRVLGGGLALTLDPAILADMAAGTGPSRSLVFLGYSGWSAGQLDREIAAKGWVVVPADAALIFDADHAAKWERAWKSRTTDL
jgi:putative transcriptional regulator